MKEAKATKRPWSRASNNLERALANSQMALRAYLGLAASLSKGLLTRGQREQVALVVSEISDCRYCTDAHAAAGQSAGLSPEDIALARRAAAADPHTEALLRFAQLVSLQRGQVSDEDYEAIRRAGVTEEELAEVIANVALTVFANYVANVAKPESDSTYTPGAIETAPGYAYS